MSYDLFGMGDNLLRTHGSDQCKGSFCCLHCPSPHHMRNWPLRWHRDRGLMQRVCGHGVAHPDPDDIAFKHRANGSYYAEVASVHDCDNCCRLVTLEQVQAQYQARWYEKTWWAWIAFCEWVKSYLPWRKRIK